MPEFKVKASALNIRSGPGTHYPVLADLSLDDVFESPDTAGWVPIVLEKEDEPDNIVVGWVSRYFLEEFKPEIVKPESQPQQWDRHSIAEDIKSECIKQELTMPEQIAYVLATADWETGRTLKPVREAYWLNEEWRKRNLRYYPYYGRGYVQLTWRENYGKYASILGIPLVDNPDLALDHANALFILVHGMKWGIFTGRKLATYINESKVDFYNARRVVNGLNKAEEIATLAEWHLKRLEESE